MLLPVLHAYITDAIRYFDSIPDERKEALTRVSNFTLDKIQNSKKAHLIYICTHNSRRSHFGQIWSKIAAYYYKIPNVLTYSAGTEATAFNLNAINSIKKTGCEVSAESTNSNPTYTVEYSNEEAPIVCFSKAVDHISIPASELCCIMTCTEAEEHCPIIAGSELRISCAYEDPKIFDGTTLQDLKYDERCKQIAVDALFAFSEVSKYMAKTQGTLIT